MSRAAAIEFEDAVRLLLASNRLHHDAWSDADELDSMLNDPGVRARLTLMARSAGQLVDAKLRRLRPILRRRALRPALARWEAAGAMHDRVKVEAPYVVRRMIDALAARAAAPGPGRGEDDVLARVARRRFGLAERRARRYHALISGSDEAWDAAAGDVGRYVVLTQCELALTGVDPTSEAALRNHAGAVHARRRYAGKVATHAQVAALCRDAPVTLTRPVVAALVRGLRVYRARRLRVAWDRLTIVTVIMRKVQERKRLRAMKRKEEMSEAMEQFMRRVCSTKSPARREDGTGGAHSTDATDEDAPTYYLSLD